MTEPLHDLTKEEQRFLKRIAKASNVNRRQLMAALASAGVGGIAGSEIVGRATAAASTTDNDGDVGTPSSRVDGFFDGIDTKSVTTEQIGSERHYAGAYDGSDPDARLSNALSAASDGDTVYLENADYSTDPSISKNIKIVGTGNAHVGIGTDFTVGVSLSGRIFATNIFFSGGVTLSKFGCELVKCRGDVTVDEDECLIEGHLRSTITFNNGTSGGMVDSTAGGTTVTDNGANSTGNLG